MRLLTLNIRFGAGTEFPEKPGYNVPVSAEKLAALSSAVESVRPDIAALQEVKSAKQARTIAERLDMQYLYCRHPSSYALDFFEWGLAFVFRYDLIRGANYSVFFDEYTRAGRQALAADFEVDGRAVTLVNLHLEQRDPEGQIQKVVALAKQRENPVVLIGDFNCAPDHCALEQVVRAGWVDTCAAAASDSAALADSVGTVPRQAARIDYIFVQPEHFDVGGVGLLPERHRHVSDHIGYFADLVIKKRRTAFSTGAPAS